MRPNPDRERHMEAVHRVLDEVDAQDVPRSCVFNKCDRLTPEERVRLDARARRACHVCGAVGEGVDELRQRR